MFGPLINIVHVSDLQAGAACLASTQIHGFTKLTLKKRYEYYGNVLARDVRRTLEFFERPDRVDVIVVTGDVANRAQPDEYRLASVFLKTVADKLKVKWRNVAVVPGNHDVDWEMLKRRHGDSRPRSRKALDACSADSYKMASFKRWFRRIYAEGAVTDYVYRFGEPIFFDALTKARQICLVGLDTCERLTHNQSANHGFVSQDQLQSALEHFGGGRSPQIKIAIMHHNPFPHEDEDSQTGLAEPERVREGLEQAGVRLILAGHMHRARHDLRSVNLTRASNTLVTGPCCMRHGPRRFAVGPSAYRKKAMKRELLEVFPNRYQIISINPLSLWAIAFLRRFTFERRHTDGTRGDWTADADPAHANQLGIYSFSLDPNHAEGAKQIKEKLNVPGIPPGLGDHIPWLQNQGTSGRMPAKPELK